MPVGISGSGPAVESVRAALEDVGAQVTAVDVDAVSEVDIAVVVSDDPDRLAAANRNARRGDTPWLGVELGGVGGAPLAEASVAGFAPETACYDCLRDRVAANRDGSAPEVETDETTARYAGALAGREAARLLQGEESPVLGGLVELPYQQRRLFPVPGCACGGETDPSLVLSTTDRELDESLARAEEVLDDRVGLVSEVGEVESFPVPYYLARTADTTGFSDAAAATEAAGVDPDWNAAFMKALGEAMERYCAGVYRTDALPRGRPGEVPGPVAPSQFVRPGDTAVADDPIRWVQGRDLKSDETVHLPAEFVQFPPPEERTRPAITTGLGLGNDTVEALTSGLTEVIERDATMLAWYSTFEPLGLTVADETFQTMASRAAAEGLEVTTVLLTQDVDVPVVAVAVEGDQFPELALGSDAGLDPVESATAALAEALQNWTELRGMGLEDATDAAGAIGRYATDPGPATDFLDPEQTVPAASVGPQGVPSGVDRFEALVDRVAGAGLDAYAARLTTRDVAQAGFEAVRVLVPSAQPLFLDTPYFGERARSVPESLGFEARLDRQHHPFP
jgi:ribosomal protein S12 methylthiotransferase accessory factor